MAEILLRSVTIEEANGRTLEGRAFRWDTSRVAPIVSATASCIT